MPEAITDTAPSPFALRNVRLFIAFRLFFSARFYYPVFTILFLDFGLTMAQFALLNAVWAATIVICEVPSGALADTIGRRRLLVLTGSLMVAEIAVLCIAPVGQSPLLLALFTVNRILSGIAEASASGADEALAYDSLVQVGLQDQWPAVLERQMRWQSVAFVVAMSVGAAVYDPNLMQSLANWLGVDLMVTRQMTLRIPLVLTLVMALVTFAITLGFADPKLDGDRDDGKDRSGTMTLGKAFALTLQAGKWILTTRFALLVIAFGMLFDSVARMVITLSSQYYRLIQLPEASFGLIGSAIALLGLVMPRLARRLAENRTEVFNLWVLAAITLAGLGGMSFFWPWVGLLPAICLFSGMYLTGFFTSHYLNRVTASDQRATVLSFKGLWFNLAYGLAGIAYAAMLSAVRGQLLAGGQGPGEGLENLVFRASFVAFPIVFVVLLALLAVAARTLPFSKEHVS